MKMALLMDEERKRIVNSLDGSLKLPFTKYLTKFLFHSIVVTQTQFSLYINGITLAMDTEFKTDEQIVQDELRGYLIEAVNEIISLSKNEKTIENFARLKYNLDYFFLNLTTKGRLIYNYSENYLLRSQIVAAELKVTKPTLLSNIDKGLEYLSERKGQKKIPRHVIFYWSNPSWTTRIMLLFQQYQQREMTTEDKYNEILSEIETYEKKYGKTFEEVFAEVLSGTVDGDDLENAEDYYDWSDLREEADAYDRLLRGYVE